MAPRERRTVSLTFKAQVAIAFVRRDKMVTDRGEKFDVHPGQIAAWKV